MNIYKNGIGVAGDTKVFARIHNKLELLTIDEVEQKTRKKDSAYTRVFEILSNGSLVRVRMAKYMPDRVLLHTMTDGRKIKTGELQYFSTEAGTIYPRDFVPGIRLRLNYKELINVYKDANRDDNPALYSYTSGKLLGAFINSGIRGYHPYDGYYIALVIDRELSYRYVTNIHSVLEYLGIPKNRRRIERKDINETTEMITIWSERYYAFISQFIDESFNDLGELQENGVKTDILLTGERFVTGYLDGFFLKDHLLDQYQYLPDEKEFEFLQCLAAQTKERLLEEVNKEDERYIRRIRKKEPFVEWESTVDVTPEPLYQIFCAASEEPYYQTADGFMLFGGAYHERCSRK